MRVVVAGAGLVGLGVAWRCAQAGLDVTVVDPAPGSGASRAAAGMLAPVTEASYGEEALTALALDSVARYPAFVEELVAATGLDVPLRTAGTLLVGFDEDDVRVLADLAVFQASLGLEVERLTPSQARRREPSLTPRLRGALLAGADLSVEPRALHAALLAACTAVGVSFVTARVDELLVEDGRCTGVVAGESLRADAVVLALGSWSGSLPGAPGLPVRPVKGQVLRLRGEQLLTGTVRALVRGRGVYLVPDGDAGLTIGATVEELGFDRRVTAGAVFELLRDAYEVVPAISELELVETFASWRPGTPDNAPLLGPSSLPGLVLATGHHRNGVLLTPVTADLVAAHLATGAEVPFPADRFGSLACA